MTIVLDRDYLRSHRREIHDYDSFGKAIVEAVLREAEKKTDGSSDQMKIDVEFDVSSVSAKGCVTVCGLGICIHVG